jgi:hypothetical protein
MTTSALCGWRHDPRASIRHPDIATLMFFGWSIYFLSNLIVEELSMVALS